MFETLSDFSATGVCGFPVDLTATVAVQCCDSEDFGLSEDPRRFLAHARLFLRINIFFCDI